MFPALILFIKGLFIGLIVSAPPGPNAILMINRFSRTLRLRSVVTITRVSGVAVISIGLLVLMTLFLSHSGISSYLPWVR